MAQSETKNSAIRKRGGDPDVKEHKVPHDKPKDEALDQKLEEGLEESMAGSDPISITQPPKSKEDKHGTPSPTKH
mgnify:FL=1